MIFENIVSAAQILIDKIQTLSLFKKVSFALSSNGFFIKIVVGSK